MAVYESVLFHFHSHNFDRVTVYLDQFLHSKDIWIFLLAYIVASLIIVFTFTQQCVSPRFCPSPDVVLVSVVYAREISPLLKLVPLDRIQGIRLPPSFKEFTSHFSPPLFTCFPTSLWFTCRFVVFWKPYIWAPFLLYYCTFVPLKLILFVLFLLLVIWQYPIPMNMLELG